MAAAACHGPSTSTSHVKVGCYQETHHLDPEYPTPYCPRVFCEYHAILPRILKPLVVNTRVSRGNSRQVFEYAKPQSATNYTINRPCLKRSCTRKVSKTSLERAFTTPNTQLSADTTGNVQSRRIPIGLVLHTLGRLGMSLAARNTPHPTNRVHREKSIPQGETKPRNLTSYSSQSPPPLSLDRSYDHCLTHRTTTPLHKTSTSMHPKTGIPIFNRPQKFCFFSTATASSLSTHIYNPDFAVESYFSSPKRWFPIRSPKRSGICIRSQMRQGN
ncbi:uncharacterized protein BDZ83DRAFT_272341 [Colletotrichum acutatum]|uniref:Uncharacterized protein n=1 Tax=Glomerella acutata TaxID=27357 RepID=A0AAD8UTP1_GLOAC|nr:uncharacterized protein BDZ83DRAFT_272341 [Colletotrichum acutatum]KAK1726130.1 hypothetical protein BDZ83DRAFT_272341 [Colletotrichum acutatum]